jgi:hypothetical protein
MLYPKDAVTTGKACPPDSPEPWEIIPWRGVELLRVKLKVCLFQFSCVWKRGACA